MVASQGNERTFFLLALQVDDVRRDLEQPSLEPFNDDRLLFRVTLASCSGLDRTINQGDVSTSNIYIIPEVAIQD